MGAALAAANLENAEVLVRPENVTGTPEAAASATQPPSSTHTAGGATVIPMTATVSAAPAPPELAAEARTHHPEVGTAGEAPTDPEDTLESAAAVEHSNMPASAHATVTNPAIPDQHPSAPAKADAPEQARATASAAALTLVPVDGAVAAYDVTIAGLPEHITEIVVSSGGERWVVSVRDGSAILRDFLPVQNGDLHVDARTHDGEVLASASAYVRGVPVPEITIAVDPVNPLTVAVKCTNLRGRTVAILSGEPGVDEPLTASVDERRGTAIARIGYQRPGLYELVVEADNGEARELVTVTTALAQAGGSAPAGRLVAAARVDDGYAMPDSVRKHIRMGLSSKFSGVQAGYAKVQERIGELAVALREAREQGLPRKTLDQVLDDAKSRFEFTNEEIGELLRATGWE
jgi:hypothetical protein